MSPEKNRAKDTELRGGGTNLDEAEFTIVTETAECRA